MHINDFVNDQTKDPYARFVLHFFCLPDSVMNDYEPWTKQFKLYCAYENERYQVLAASQSNIKIVDLLGGTFQVDIDQCSDWSDELGLHRCATRFALDRRCGNYAAKNKPLCKSCMITPKVPTKEEMAEHHEALIGNSNSVTLQPSHKIKIGLCGKQVYPSEDHSKEVMRRVQKHRNVKLRSYFCDECKGWHLSSNFY